MNKEQEKEYFRRNVLHKYQTEPMSKEECQSKLEALMNSKNKVLAVLRKLNTEIAVTEGLLNEAR